VVRPPINLAAPQTRWTEPRSSSRRSSQNKRAGSLRRVVVWPWALHARTACAL